jgi:hypothetical protein
MGLLMDVVFGFQDSLKANSNAHRQTCDSEQARALSLQPRNSEAL